MCYGVSSHNEQRVITMYYTEYEVVEVVTEKTCLREAVERHVITLSGKDARLYVKENRHLFKGKLKMRKVTF